LSLKCENQVSNFAFKCNLHRYCAAAAAAGITVGAAAKRNTAAADADGKNPFAGLLDAFSKGKERALQDKGVMVMAGAVQGASRWPAAPDESARFLSTLASLNNEN
jgi:hypothetical protein